MAVPEFKSLEDVRRYVQELSARKAEDDRNVKFWRAVERVILLLALAGSFYNYYALNVMTEIMALPRLEVAVVRAPTRTAP